MRSIIDGMQSAKTRVIFDTCGLNELRRDPNQQTLIERLGARCEVRISETSVVELSATQDSGKRRQLVDVCERLLRFGLCLMPHNWILEEMPRLHRRYGDRFRWEDLDITAPMIEQEIIRREFLNQDKVAEESREYAITYNTMFVAVFEEVRDMFADQFFDDIKNLTLSEFIAFYKAPGGPFWKMVSGWYERARLIPLNEEEARKFIAICPPFHALVLGVAVAHYQYGIPRGSCEAEYDAGRNDLFMGVYLPYCDWFITNDSGQQNAFRAITKEVGLNTAILSYKDLCAKL